MSSGNRREFTCNHNRYSKRYNQRNTNTDPNTDRFRIYHDKLEDIRIHEEYKKKSRYINQSTDFPELPSNNNSRSNHKNGGNDNEIDDKNELSKKIALTEEQNLALREENRKRSRQKMIEQKAREEEQAKAEKSKITWSIILSAQRKACYLNNKKINHCNTWWL